MAEYPGTTALMDALDRALTVGLPFTSSRQHIRETAQRALVKLDLPADERTWHEQRLRESDEADAAFVRLLLGLIGGAR